MRNSKVKGFTLIELIVVIAIIGILAAILVPSMLGYVRNARISQANANAKQVHTACSSALTQLGIANKNLTPSAGAGTDPTVYQINVPAAKISGGAALIDATFKTPGVDTITAKELDLVSYLGENFTGNGIAYYNPSTYSVTVALYAAGTADSASAMASNAALNKATDRITNNSGTIKNAITEVNQKDDAKEGTLYGVYPQGAGS